MPSFGKTSTKKRDVMHTQSNPTQHPLPTRLYIVCLLLAFVLFPSLACQELLTSNNANNASCNPWEQKTLTPTLQNKDAVIGCLVAYRASGARETTLAKLSNDGTLQGWDGTDFSKQTPPSITTPPGAPRALQIVFAAAQDQTQSTNDINANFCQNLRTIQSVFSCLNDKSNHKQCSFLLAFVPKSSERSIITLPNNEPNNVKRAGDSNTCRLFFDNPTTPKPSLQVLTTQPTFKSTQNDNYACTCPDENHYEIRYKIQYKDKEENIPLYDQTNGIHLLSTSDIQSGSEYMTFAAVHYHMDGNPSTFNVQFYGGIRSVDKLPRQVPDNPVETALNRTYTEQIVDLRHFDIGSPKNFAIITKANVYIWDIKKSIKGNRINESAIQPTLSDGQFITNAVLTRGAEKLFAYLSLQDKDGNGSIQVWEGSVKEESWTLIQTVQANSIQTLLFERNGKHLIGGGLTKDKTSGALYVYTTDESNGKLEGVYEIKLNVGPAYPVHLALSPDNEWLAIGLGVDRATSLLSPSNIKPAEKANAKYATALLWNTQTGAVSQLTSPQGAELFRPFLGGLAFRRDSNVLFALNQGSPGNMHNAVIHVWKREGNQFQYKTEVKLPDLHNATSPGGSSSFTIGGPLMPMQDCNQLLIGTKQIGRTLAKEGNPPQRTMVLNSCTKLVSP